MNDGQQTRFAEGDSPLKGITPRILRMPVDTDGAGFAVVDLGVPAEGYSWDVRSMNIVPRDWVTKDTNVLLYPAVTSNPAMVNPADVIGVRQSAPYGFTWGRSRICRGGEHLLLVVYSAAASARFVVSATVEEWRSGAL